LFVKKAGANMSDATDERMLRDLETFARRLEVEAEVTKVVTAVLPTPVNLGAESAKVKCAVHIPSAQLRV
jgi:hypothetical protein